MRSDSRRIADRIERAPVHAPPSLESAAHAAVAAAILPTAIEDVSIRPMPVKPSLFEPTQARSPAPEPQMPATYIPPAPERYARAPRMPRIDELPLPAQNEIRAQRGELGDDHPEKRRMTLMQRLASVGIGRRADAEPPAPPPCPGPRGPCRNMSVQRNVLRGTAAGRPAGRAGLRICPEDGPTGSGCPRPHGTCA